MEWLIAFWSLVYFITMRHYLPDKLKTKQKLSYGLVDYPDFAHLQVDSDVLLGFPTSLEEAKFRVYFLTPQR